MAHKMRHRKGSDHHHDRGGYSRKVRDGGDAVGLSYERLYASTPLWDGSAQIVPQENEEEFPNIYDKL